MFSRLGSIEMDLIIYELKYEGLMTLVKHMHCFLEKMWTEYFCLH